MIRRSNFSSRRRRWDIVKKFAYSFLLLATITSWSRLFLWALMAGNTSLCQVRVEGVLGSDFGSILCCLLNWWWALESRSTGSVQLGPGVYPVSYLLKEEKKECIIWLRYSKRVNGHSIIINPILWKHFQNWFNFYGPHQIPLSGQSREEVDKI